MCEDILKEKLNNEIFAVINDGELGTLLSGTEKTGLAWDITNFMIEKYEFKEKQLSLFERS